MKNFKTEGFTILELIILIVIGSVMILSIVVITPQIQKNQRNSRRVSDARRVMSAAITYYQSNSGTASASVIVSGSFDYASFNDPTNTSYFPASCAVRLAGSGTCPLVNASEANKMLIELAAKCSGNDVVPANDTSKQNVAVSVYQEPSSSLCISNN